MKITRKFALGIIAIILAGFIIIDNVFFGSSFISTQYIHMNASIQNMMISNEEFEKQLGQRPDVKAFYTTYDDVSIHHRWSYGFRIIDYETMGSGRTAILSVNKLPSGDLITTFYCFDQKIRSTKFNPTEEYILNNNCFSENFVPEIPSSNSLEEYDLFP